MMELKYAMEKLGHPQTHVGLKAMIKEIDEDHDGQISLKEFLTIFVKAAKGELQCEGLSFLAKEVNVAEEGVEGAKGFFEKHIAAQTSANKNESEIRQEQEQRKKDQADKAVRKAAFKEKAGMFNK